MVSATAFRECIGLDTTAATFQSTRTWGTPLGAVRPTPAAGKHRNPRPRDAAVPSRDEEPTAPPAPLPGRPQRVRQAA